MPVRRAALVSLVAAGAAVLALSGGTATDPRTPTGLAGLPGPLMGTAVVGGGGATAAIDAYGTVVDLRPGGPAEPAVVEIAPGRQAAGTASPEMGRPAHARIGGRTLPFWRADAVRQRYRPGTNVLVTTARFGDKRAAVTRAVGDPAAAARADRRWLARARPLGDAAPAWARRLYARSLLVLRALTDRRTGAAAAGARPGWAYVWPRDAGTAALAFAAAGYRGEAARIARFLLSLDLGAAARFHGDRTPVPGRAAQGDATGWTAAAAHAAGLATTLPPSEWRDRADYQEKAAGEYLGNAIAAGAPLGPFTTPRGLVRVAGDPASGLDSVAAWAVRPFPRPTHFPTVRRTLHALAAGAGPYGIVPSQDWDGGSDPWTAPTAWTAWGLAALANHAAARDRPRLAARDRAAALRLFAALRRGATPLGLLPERVDSRTGLPASTTPLAWSHSFAILTLRGLWP